MIIDITKLSRPPVVRVQIGGEASLSELVNLIDTLDAVYAPDWPTSSLLFNASAMPALPNDAVQAGAGRYLAQKLSHVRKIAAVVAPGQQAEAGEQAVRSLGGNLLVFHDERSAMDWLRDRAP